MAVIRTVARNATLQGGADFVGKVLSLVLYAVLARQLGGRAFGEFTFAFSLTSLLVTLAAGGIDAVVVREVARDRAVLPRLFWNAVAMRAALGGIAVLATVVIAYVAEFDVRVQLAAGLLGLTMLFEAMAKLLGAVFLALDDMRPVARTLVVQRAQTAMVGVGALVLGAGIVVVAAIFALSAAVAMASLAVTLHRRVGLPPRVASRRGVRELIVLSLPLGVSSIFTTVLFRVDTIILSAIASVTAVGLYGAAYRLLDATLFISWAVTAALSPTLARAGRTTSPSAGEAYAAGLKALFVLLLPLGTALALFGGYVVTAVFGDDFAGATTSARWLAVTVALYGVSYVGTTVAYTQGTPRVVPWVTGVAAFANISLNFLLIPRYSLVGAAVATSVAEVGRGIALTVIGIRLTGALPWARIVLGPLCGALAMVVPRLVLGEGVAALVLAPPCYLGVLFLLEQGLFPADIAMARGALRRRGGGGRRTADLDPV